MRRVSKTAALILFVFALPVIAEPASSRTEAPPFVRPAAPPPATLRATPPELETLLDDPQVVALFRDLFLLSGAGTTDFERAAFLVRDGGRWSCLLWPMKMRFRSEEFAGVVPAGTVAIIHTHPNGIVHASKQDRESARATRLPLFTITQGSITVVDPVTGTERWAVRHQVWTRSVPAALIETCRCREIGAPNRAPLPGGLLAGAGQ
ncbi:MAG TPA: hypothetical protein VMS56_10365 [Thermoanaerobaculia bacterium]|nr:hypothetical protein [Thermoanaerobaculia bacterium]